MKITPLEFAYFALCGIYLGLMHLTPFEGDFVSKAAPLIILLVMTFQKLNGRTFILLFAAQVFSAGGDIALTFVRGVNQNFFILGLALFLTAHIFYAILFAGQFQIRKDRLPLASMLLVFAVVMGVLMAPNLGDLQIPVFAYLTVITVMGMLSMMRMGNDTLLMVGAIIFILSDSCIAVNKFLHPFEGAGYAIMITYYAAQWMIAKSFLSASASKNN
jgi:alkenylglycerophosphocholine hydrolase